MHLFNHTNTAAQTEINGRTPDLPVSGTWPDLMGDDAKPPS